MVRSWADCSVGRLFDSVSLGTLSPPAVTVRGSHHLTVFQHGRAGKS